MITITWPENTVACAKCDQLICTYQQVTITVKGTFTVLSKNPFIQDGEPIIEHQICPKIRPPIPKPDTAASSQENPT